MPLLFYTVTGNVVGSKIIGKNFRYIKSGMNTKTDTNKPMLESILITLALP